MNIIIHSYTNKCKTVPVPPGLADFLRGTMFLYQETKTHPNMDLVVDFSRHPIHQYIEPLPKNKTPPYDKILEQQNLEIIECFHKDNYKVLNAVELTNTPNQPPLRVFCFQYYDEFNTTKALPNDTQSFMKQVLTFTPELQEDVDDILHQLLPNPDKPFCILHIRTGDHNANKDQLQINAELDHYITTKILTQWGNQQVIVMSDSYHIKNMISKRYGIHCTDFMPVHLGTTTRFMNPNYHHVSDDSDIAKTLIEFIIMSKASHIYMYSIYDWGSGFSYICSHIYDIPYTRIGRLL